MSTKIYTAFKLKRSRDLWPLVRDIKAKGQANVKKVLAAVYEGVRATAHTETEKYLKARKIYGDDEWMARHSVAERLIRERYEAQLGVSHRNEYDFNVSVGVWEYKRGLYLIPHCDMLMRKTLDFLVKDQRLENFQYWNNTDRPRGVSQLTWDKRRDVWNEIYRAGWGDSVSIEVLSFSNYIFVDPYADEIRKHQRTKS